MGIVFQKVGYDPIGSDSGWDECRSIGHGYLGESIWLITRSAAIYSLLMSFE